MGHPRATSADGSGDNSGSASSRLGRRSDVAEKSPSRPQIRAVTAFWAQSRLISRLTLKLAESSRLACQIPINWPKNGLGLLCHTAGLVATTLLSISTINTAPISLATTPPQSRARGRHEHLCCGLRRSPIGNTAALRIYDAGFQGQFGPSCTADEPAESMALKKPSAWLKQAVCPARNPAGNPDAPRERIFRASVYVADLHS